MAVRLNTIISPREEISDLRAAIEHEKEIRRSLRVSLRPEYYSSQKEYLEAQIKVFQDKLDTLTDRFMNGQTALDASEARQKSYEQKLFAIQNRDKILKYEALKTEIERIANELAGV